MSSGEGRRQGAGQGGREFSRLASLSNLPGSTSEDRVTGGGAAGSANSPKPPQKGRRRLPVRTPSLPGDAGARSTGEPRNVANASRRLVSLAAAAAHADVSTRTLRRYISQGRLTGYRVGPRLIKIDLNELDSLATPIPNRNIR